MHIPWKLKVGAPFDAISDKIWSVTYAVYLFSTKNSLFISKKSLS